MKKNLLLVYVLISTFGFSQVSLRKTTKTATTHLEETMNCVNGTNSYTISGSVNLNVGNTNSWGAIIALFFPDGSFTEPVGTASTNTSINNIIIGGININWFMNSTFERQSLIPSTNSYNASLSILEKTALANINGDFPENIFGVDSRYMSWYISNVNNVPINSILALETPQLNDGASAPIHSAKIFYLKWTGTEWIHTQVGPTGWASNPILQEWDTNSLTIPEIEKSEKQLFLYPNPTNNLITIQNRQNSKENFEYKIIDVTGRIVKSGNSKFNEQINIESLTSGNYIIQIQPDSNQFITQKILKN